MQKRERKNELKEYYPFCVQIELVQGCNRRCSFCGTRGIENRIYYMHLETLLHIVLLLKAANYKGRILLAGHGEPSLHPELIKCISVIKKHLPKCYTSIFTNGYNFLKKQELIHEAFQAGINAIMFDEYDDNRIANDVLRIKGINRYPIELLQAGVPMFDQTKKQRIIIAPPIDSESSSMSHKLCNHCGAGLPPLKEPLKKKCSIIFRDFFIRWDGWISICCNDFRGEYPVTNILECKTFEEAYYHPRLEAARRRLMQNDRNFFPCSVCNESPMRPGLLPTPNGKTEMPPPTDYDIMLSNERLPALSKIEKREWENE